MQRLCVVEPSFRGHTESQDQEKCPLNGDAPSTSQYSNSRKNRKLHHGKFEITNIADNQVNLTPEDIPGARFSEKEKGKLTVAQLKFWLKCRGINQNGNLKKETVGKVGVHHLALHNQSAVYVVYFQLQT